MRAGTLRHRLSIQTAVDTQDATTGEPVRSWATLATVWAEIAPIRAREAVRNGIALTEMDTVIKLRWTPALANLGTKSRAVHTLADGRNDVIYDIVSAVEPKLNRRDIELLCLSGANEG